MATLSVHQAVFGYISWQLLLFDIHSNYKTNQQYMQHAQPFGAKRLLLSLRKHLGNPWKITLTVDGVGGRVSLRLAPNYHTLIPERTATHAGGAIDLDLSTRLYNDPDASTLPMQSCFSLQFPSNRSAHVESWVRLLLLTRSDGWSWPLDRFTCMLLR